MESHRRGVRSNENRVRCAASCLGRPARRVEWRATRRHCTRHWRRSRPNWRRSRSRGVRSVVVRRGSCHAWRRSSLSRLQSGVQRSQSGAQRSESGAQRFRSSARCVESERGCSNSMSRWRCHRERCLHSLPRGVRPCVGGLQSDALCVDKSLWRVGWHERLFEVASAMCAVPPNRCAVARALGGIKYSLVNTLFYFGCDRLSGVRSHFIKASPRLSIRSARPTTHLDRRNILCDRRRARHDGRTTRRCS